MDVTELNREQLTELKQGYYTELVNEGTFAEVIGRNYDEPSYLDLAEVDSIISDEFIKDYYAGVDFVMDDFFCTAGKEIA
jgi:hypothetical protein